MKEKTSGSGGSTAKPNNPPTTARRGRPRSAPTTPNPPTQQHASDAAEEFYSQRYGSAQPVVAPQWSAPIAQAEKNATRDLREVNRDTTRSFDPRNITNPYFQKLIDPATGDAKIDTSTPMGGISTSVEQGYNAGMAITPPPDFKFENWMKAHPQIAQAGLAAKISASDWKTLKNYYDVQDAKSLLSVAARFKDPQRISIVYAGLPANVRDVAVQQLRDASVAQDPTAAANPDDQSTWLTNSWDWAWGHSIGPAMDTWQWSIDQAQHVNRAAQLETWNNPQGLQEAFNSGGTPGLAVHQALAVPGNWDATADGSYDPKQITAAVKQFGATDVQMIKDLNDSIKNTQDPFGLFVQQYASDPHALDMLHMWMDDTVRTDQFNSLLASVNGASTSDLGNMTMSHLFGAENSNNTLYKIGAGGSNALSVIASDPLFIASKGFQAIKIAKYAMAMGAIHGGEAASYAAAGGRIEHLMQLRSVRRFWNEMGALGKEYRAAKKLGNDELAARVRYQMDRVTIRALGRRENMMQSSFHPTRASDVGSRPDPNLPPLGDFRPDPAHPRYTTLADEIIKQEIDNADVATEWLKSGIGLEMILQGSPAATVQLMPRLTAVSRVKLTRMLQSRTFDWQKHGWDFIRTYYGQDLNPKAIGIALSDKGTLVDRAAQLGVDQSKAKRLWAGVEAHGPGKANRSRGIVQSYNYGDRSTSRRIDRFLKNFTRSPFSRSIFIADPRDVEKIRAWARVTLDKSHADLLADTWFDATPAERRSIVQGLGLTAMHGMGIGFNEAETAKSLLAMPMDGLSVGTNYGTSYHLPAVDVSGTGDVFPVGSKSMHALDGLRLDLAGGNLEGDAADLWFRQNLAGMIQKRTDLMKLRSEIQEKLSAFKRVKGGEAVKNSLKEQLQVVVHELNVNGSEITKSVAENGKQGRIYAAQAGLESVGSISELARETLAHASGDVRDAGLLALRDTTSAAKDAAAAGKAGWSSTASGAVRDMRAAAKQPGVREDAAVKDAASTQRERISMEGKVQGVFDQATVDASRTGRGTIRDAANDAQDLFNTAITEASATAAEDIRLAKYIQEALGEESTKELRGLFKQLQETRRTARKAAGRNLTDEQKAALIAKADRVQGRIDELTQQAGLSTWRINNVNEAIKSSSRWRAAADGVVQVNPAIIDGKSYALHVRQTADHISLPDFQKMQQLAARTGVINATLGMSYTDWATGITDAWSLLTLAGPRYAIRNSIEDLIIFNLSGGRYRDYFRGRSAVKAIRRASGHGRGVIGNLMDAAEAKWRPYISDGELETSMRAAKDGDMEPFRLLVARGVARGQVSMFGPRFKGEQAYKYLDELIESGHVDQLLSSIARTAVQTVRQINTTGDTLALASKDLKEQGINGYRRSASANAMLNKDVRWVDLNTTSQEGIDAWWQHIHDFSEGDGAIGKIAIRGIRKLNATKFGDLRVMRNKIVQEIVTAIEKNADKSWSYKQRFSMISEKGSETFARSYLNEAETIFSGRVRGQYNMKLIDKLHGSDGKNIGLWDMEKGKKIYRVRRDELMQMEDRPSQVLGPETQHIPMYNGVQNGMQSLWQVMGDQYARISTEPMFLGRYLENRTELAGYEQALAHQFGDDVAAKTVQRMAADRAYEGVFSYADNPANRSLLAFNARNVARYYRATEDFYRRVARLVKYHPDQVVKAALVANVLDDSGFIHQDDQGNKYFMYPNGIPLINSVMSYLNVPIHIPSVLGQWSGRFDMLAPSAAADANLPSFSGPFLAAPIAAIAQVWEPFQAFEGATMGQKSVGRDFLSTILPPPIVSLIGVGSGYLQSDDAVGKFSANLRNVLFARAAVGDMPGDGASPQDLENWKNDSRQQAESMTLLQMVLRMGLPASPQFNAGLSGHVSSEAAAAGLGNLRTDFLKMVTAHAKDPDPWAAAMTDWIQLNPSWSIWTVSKSTDTSTALIRSTDAAANWARDNRDLFNLSSEGAGYLVPPGVASTLDANRRLVAYGVKMQKPVAELALQIVTARANQQYWNVVDSAQAAIDAEPDAAIRRDAQARLSAKKQEMFKENPLVAARVKNPASRIVKDTSLKEISKVIDYVKQNRHAQYTSDSSYALIETMISDYNAGMISLAQITGTTKQDKDLKSSAKAGMRNHLREIAGLPTVNADGTTTPADPNRVDQRAIQVYSSLMAYKLGDADA